jgi:hypothetical protein
MRRQVTTHTAVLPSRSLPPRVVSFHTTCLLSSDQSAPENRCRRAVARASSMADLLQRLGLTRTAPEDNAVCYALYPAAGTCTSGACSGVGSQALRTQAAWRRGSGKRYRGWRDGSIKAAPAPGAAQRHPSRRLTAAGRRPRRAAAPCVARGPTGPPPLASAHPQTPTSRPSRQSAPPRCCRTSPDTSGSAAPSHSRLAARSCPPGSGPAAAPPPPPQLPPQPHPRLRPRPRRPAFGAWPLSGTTSRTNGS